MHDLLSIRNRVGHAVGSFDRTALTEALTPSILMQKWSDCSSCVALPDYFYTDSGGDRIIARKVLGIALYSHAA